MATLTVHIPSWGVQLATTNAQRKSTMTSSESTQEKASHFGRFD